MKKLSFLMAAALMVLVGCNKETDGLGGGKTGGSGEQVWLGFSISTVGTKSDTESGDDDDYGYTNADPNVEVGSAVENAVNSIDLVLVKQSDRFSGTTPVSGPVNAIVARKVDFIGSADGQSYVASFDSDVLEENTDYLVYVYVNADAKVTASGDASTFDVEAATTSVTLDGNDVPSVASADGFLMTNAYRENVHNVATITSLKEHNSPSNPLDLGTIEVERAAARFDYMDYNANGNVYVMAEDKDGNATVQITLQDIALVNMSKSCYDFRRVSADGTSTSWIIGGVETMNNYVVDTDWEAKKAGTATDFYYPYNSADEDSYVWTKLSSLSTADNYDQADVEDDYKVWRYAVENTIPEIEKQIKGQTTGVAFRGRITATDKCDAELKSVIDAAESTIYVYGNVIYGTWEMVAEAAAKAATDDSYINLKVAYDNVQNNVKSHGEAGFTGYTPRTVDGVKGYFTTYYYWNRHNDNTKNYEMSNMEFAVVRNNVYKLAVTSVDKFGHPYNDDPDTPDPDPAPENPEDPDEDESFYFTVSVKVLPWVVRINNVEF